MTFLSWLRGLLFGPFDSQWSMERWAVFCLYCGEKGYDCTGLTRPYVCLRCRPAPPPGAWSETMERGRRLQAIEDES
jgi:hypothetical protein